MFDYKNCRTYAVRKLSMGVSSIVIAAGVMVFAGHGAQAAEMQDAPNVTVNDDISADVSNGDHQTQQLETTGQSFGDTNQTEAVQPQAGDSEAHEDVQKAQPVNPNDAVATGDQEKPEVDPDYSVATGEQEKPEVDPDYSVATGDQEKPEVDPDDAVAKGDQEKPEVDPDYSVATGDQEKPEVDPDYSVAKDEQEKPEVDPDYSVAKEDQEKPEVDPDYSVVNRDSKDNKETQQAPTTEKAAKETTNTQPKTSQAPTSKPAPVQPKAAPQTKAQKKPAAQQQVKATQPKEKKAAPQLADQGQFKNRDPIIFVHGFSGFVGDNAPTGSNYWGGNKVKLIENLRNAGYNVFEASVSAFGSNWDRAVELYHYIKGGVVDYGQAHAAKYGHERYGRTYEGILPDWQPGQAIHLVGHSMGGQTIRMLEDLLRKGDPEEIAYQQQHGGTISPLFQGGHDHLIDSITTIATPHGGTVASDDLGNTEFIKRVLYEVSLFAGRQNSKIDYGLKQWGLEQREGETYAEYAKRASQSPLFNSEDTALYDLTREGAQKLNQRTDLNPDIYYKTYTGSATNETVFGTQMADAYMNIAHVLTGNFIGSTKDEAWRENDGLVSVISALHPDDEAFVNVAFDTPPEKGIWQVTPVMKDWDHTDFTGQDTLDWHRSADELTRFYLDLVNDLVRKETAE